MDIRMMKKLLVLMALIGATVVYGFVRAQGPEVPSGAITAAPAASTDAVPAAVSASASSGAGSMGRMMGSGMAASGMRDGVYTGTAVDAFYGMVQVKATISGGKITDVTFLEYPNDRDTSRFISQQAMPILSHEAIVAQSARVNVVSGATQTSQGFEESLSAALAQAS